MFFIKSLKAKMLLPALIPVIFGLATLAITSPYAYQWVVEDVAQQRDTELARVLAGRLNGNLHESVHTLEMMAAQDGVLSLEPARLTAVLEESPQRAIFDAGVAVYDGQGLALWPRQDTGFPLSSEFDELRRTLRPVLSDIFIDDASGEDAILIGLPILGGDGEFRGVMAGLSTVKYSRLAATFAEALEFQAGRGGHAYLVDGNGRVIWHRDSSLVGTRLAGTVPVERVLQEENAAVITKDTAGETVISAFAPVPGTSWGLITQERWEGVVDPIRDYIWLRLGQLALGGALAGGVVFWLIGHILRPIQDLTRSAQRIAGGDFDHRIAARTGDEIEGLAEQFNTMAGALKGSFAKLEQRLGDLALLFEASTTLSSSLDMGSVLQTIALHVVAALGVDGCAISRWDREGDAVVTLLDHRAELDLDWWQPEAPGTVYPLSDYPAARRVLTDRQPLTIQASDLDADPAERAWMQAEGFKSLLMTPLVIGDRVIGLLELMQCQKERMFTSNEISLCQTLANQAASALENARLFQETRRRSRELALLNRIIAASAVRQTVESLLETVCRELAQVLDVPQAAAALLNEKKTKAVVMAEYLAEGRPSALGEVIPVEGNLSFRYLLEHQVPLVVDNAQTDPRLAPIHDLERRRGTVSLLILPLVVEGEVVGSLGVDAIELRPFSAEEVDLAQRVAEQISGVLARLQLEKERQRLEEQFRQAQKLEAVGRLAGGVAHDFNNLLTVIHLSTRLLEKKLHPGDPLWQHVQRIQGAGRRAADLTRQLLAFSRREIIEPKVLDLNELLSDLSKMLRRLLGEDVELALALADNLWPVHADPTQVEQVIMNLVVNARDAMPGGGVLTLETDNVVLDAAYTARHLDVDPGEYVLLAVSDTGVGMGDEVKAHLFEPFFTTKEKGKGTGLGLSTVFGIVKQNRGHVWVYSEVGRGTTFKVYLPRSGRADVWKPPALPMDAEARGSETILLVEDDAGVRELAVHILKMQGYQVLAAAEGPEALQIAAQYAGPIHLLLSDVVMPRMSGRELADQLRSRHPQVRVLYMSGYTDNAIVHHGVLEAGIAFLAKPLTEEGLLRKVRAVLDAPE